jgi:hypothetical protein
MREVECSLSRRQRIARDYQIKLITRKIPKILRRKIN